ncbi:hypothetical protein RB595_008774 [Gaeumannomyces hyphopodioides]
MAASALSDAHAAKDGNDVVAEAGPSSSDESQGRRSRRSRSSSSSSSSSDRRPPRESLNRTKSAATDASAYTTASATVNRLREEWAARPWHRKLNPLRWGTIPPIPDERAECPEYRANFLSALVFSWMAPLMATGYRRPLQATDIWAVNPRRAVEPTTDRVRESFRRRVAKGEKRPLLWALNEAYFWEFWAGGVCGMVSTLCQVMSPFMLRFLIAFATDAYLAAQLSRPQPNLGTGFGLVIGVTVLQLLQSLCIHQFMYRGMLVGGQSRASLISMIYDKSMVISGRAKAGGASDGKAEGAADAKGDSKNKGKGKGPSKKPRGDATDAAGWANGRIMNLMSVDTYRIDTACGLFHIVWTAPVSLVVTLVVLLVNLGPSALAGFGLLVIGAPLLARAVRSLFARRRAINRITDQRVSLTQEILQSVRFVKYFGWEESFLQRLNGLRTKEVSSIQVLLALRNAILAISLSLPVFAAMLSFVTYSLSGNTLRSDIIFSSLALFNSLRMPLNLLPLVIGQITDGWSSLKRIQDFLLAEEQVEDVVHKPDGENALEMHGAGFTWEKTSSSDGQAKQGELTRGAKGQAQPAGSSEKNTGSGSAADEEPFKLQDLSFKIGRDELVAVIGTVGSGKSSLLSALAGDMRKTDGEVVLGASRAFCPQYAWIQNTTVRDNITFGKEMDEDWYHEVIKACALKPDLEMLPNGDLTEIGERGITISGGQKQRLNIARAIYFDADIVLMDDPLSAVDAHVGRHIFDNAILGLLGDKCRILATHQLWVLNRCDRIIWMDGGKIQAIDTFDNLMSGHAGFRQLMESQSLERKKDEAEGGAPGASADAGADEVEKKTKLKKGKSMMQTEEQAVSSVPWSVYGDFIRASGSILAAPATLVLLIVSQGANIVTSLWLSWWTGDKYGFAPPVYMGVYAGLGVVQVVLTFGFMVALSIFGTRASKLMLRRAMARVLRAPMAFFDTTPLGRITNRFSRDVDVMDNNLSESMRMYFFSVSSILSVFALIIAFFHWFAIALVPLSCAFLLATVYYRASAREVKRFESTLRSALFARFGEGLSGVASIRAYGLQSRFGRDLRRSIDDMNGAYYLTYSNQRWLSVRLDAVGACLVFVTGVLVLTSRFDVAPNISGLVLSYILAIVQMLQFTIRQLAEVENGMNAVERLRYYGTELDEEAPLHIKGVEMRPSWPETGEISFENVEMRYRAGLPLVLRGLDMRVRGGERIGIVGRTGAGKSSIMSTLFRLVELSGGRILIDGVDIATIGLADLRSRLAIIPQDPTLFKGTVRNNLDPFDEHSDLELWDALRQADLVGPDNTAPIASTVPVQEGQAATAEAAANGNAKAVTSRIHLDSIVEEEGLNFSLGQRQLMALARALVRGSRIIVCDEATSSVDMETDAKIQATMAAGFRGRTLLCIAHRLHTIIGYDRICVMDQGRIAELDDPLELWRRGADGGIFRGMCDRSGIREEDIIAAKQGLGLGALVAGGGNGSDDDEAGREEKSA